MSRKGRVFFKGIAAGIIEEHDDGYRFQYLSGYLDRKDAVAVSLTLPLRGQPYESRAMIPFFDGLIPEGWLLSVAVRNWKLDARDRMGLLLSCCGDCIGAVTIKDMTDE